MEYKGIQLDENCRLIMKNGGYDPKMKKALDKFIAIIEEVNFKIVGKFKSVSKATVEIQCDKGHILPVYPNNFNRYKSCGICSEKIASVANEKAKERFLKFVKENGHEAKSDYIDNKTDILIDFKCEHGCDWIRPHNYNNGPNCSKCTVSKTAELNIKRAEKKFFALLEKNNHTAHSDYKGRRHLVLIDFKCKHGKQWRLAGNYMERSEDSACLECWREQHFEKSKKYLFRILKENGFEAKSDYKGDKEKMLIDFKCEHVPNWIVPYAIKGGHGCPHCAETKGEKIIREWLESNNIKHVPQYRFKQKNMRKAYKYDFVLHDKKIVIEIHGRQHYEEAESFTRQTLAEIQANDKRKKNYAEFIGYKYIEVNYREHNPELALERFLKEFDLLDGTKQKQLSLF